MNCIWIENALGWIWIRVEARKVMVWRRNIVTGVLVACDDSVIAKFNETESEIF